MKLRTKISLGLLAVSLIAGGVYALIAYRHAHAGVMAQVGIGGPEDIKTFGATGANFQDPYSPMYWVSDRKKITQLYLALMDEKRVLTGDQAYLAIVGKKGQIILFNLASQSQMGPGERLVNYKQYMPGLNPFPLSNLLDCEPCPSKLRVNGPVSITNYTGGNKTWTKPLVSQTSTDPRLWPLAYRLVRQFNPDAITPIGDLPEVTVDYWNAHCNHMEISLSTPLSFRVLVYPKHDMQSLSDLPCADATFRVTTVDTFIASRDDEGILKDRPTMGFVFGSKGKAWYRTGSLPRREIKGYDKDGNPIMGKDLFDELVKELMKTAE
jgi:hypothetical protein